MAVAPASAAAGPPRTAARAPGGPPPPRRATGTRARSTASPAAAQPTRPASATTSPGRAPDRVTGGRPWSDPSAVIASVSVADVTTSPPTRPAPTTAASAQSPSASPVIVSTGGVGGAASPTSSAVGTAPIAAMSARLAAAALRPTCSGVDQSNRKCTPATSTSVVATTRPSDAATTAASSPGPRTVLAGWTRSRVTCAMSPNSPSPAIVRRSSGKGPPRVRSASDDLMSIELK